MILFELMLRIEALTKIFEENKAVDAASIKVTKPSMIGVTGWSGAGKSMPLRMDVVSNVLHASPDQVIRGSACGKDACATAGCN